MSKHRQSHVSGWLAILLTPIAVPIILLVKLAERVFRLKTTADLTPADVVSYLDDFIDDRSGDWDWDDFTSIHIANPALDEIRAEAAALSHPLDDSEVAKLKHLLMRARQLEAAGQIRPA